MFLAVGELAHFRLVGGDSIHLHPPSREDPDIRLLDVGFWPRDDLNLFTSLIG